MYPQIEKIVITYIVLEDRDHDSDHDDDDDDNNDDDDNGRDDDSKGWVTA